MLIVGTGVGHANELSLDSARNLPVGVQKGIEIASRTGSDNPASLNLICSSDGDKHFVLITRLPFPRWLEGRYRRGASDRASLFVNGIGQKLDIAFEMINIGPSAATLSNFLGIADEGEPDTAFSVPLMPEHVDALENWFGATSPEKVSVVGLLETGVFMRGLVTGDAIHEFGTSCAPSR